MEISQEIEIVDLALWIKKEQILIIGDLHLGYEEYMQKKGIFLPKFQIQEITKRLQKIIQKTKPQIIIINGDLKHEFGKVLSQEWEDVLQLIDFLTKNSKEIILIKGNHDKILGPIALKRNIKVLEKYEVDNILIVHGDKTIPTTKKRVVIGHEHPAIVLKDHGKVEKFKCFLKGKYKQKELIVMPSFNPLLEGTDILKEKLLSPYLKDVSKFQVFVVGEEIFNFGTVRELRQ
ncbi:phosphoesterase [Candidatus Woesearchaeota archaeon CG_4_10_14_0_2_um_filter_33_13]|nr:MAG: phosphoesterase [Candidatus Woesearchaeota archaeon CG_4_10_14_0_2_um_filter_33_13]